MNTSNTKTSRIAAILGEQIGKVAHNPLRYVDIESIVSNPDQPRKHFDEEKLEELAQSIRQYGVLQPVILQEIGNEKYAIIAGERRWRACKIANMQTLPAIIKSPKEQRDSDAVALIENLQRQNLSITEEASYYASFIEKYDYTQDQLSQIIGKSRSHIANLLRINTLPESIKGYLEQQKISMGHAKIIAGRSNVESIVKVILEKNLNVRQTEEFLQSIDQKDKSYSIKKDKKKIASPDHSLDVDIAQIEEMISQKLGSHALIDKVKGELTIRFKDLVELDCIIAKLYKIPKEDSSEI
jgi:ParB family transcriptional regulator, chromosome partitioning protein